MLARAKTLWAQGASMAAVASEFDVSKHTLSYWRAEERHEVRDALMEGVGSTSSASATSLRVRRRDEPGRRAFGDVVTRRADSITYPGLLDFPAHPRPPPASGCPTTIGARHGSIFTSRTRPTTANPLSSRRAARARLGGRIRSILVAFRRPLSRLMGRGRVEATVRQSQKATT